MGDSSDVIYRIDLNSFNVEAFGAALQKEKNGKPLPGPRDDFCLVSSCNSADKSEVQPIYLIGGYRNGQKMSDIYKLHILDGVAR